MKKCRITVLKRYFDEELISKTGYSLRDLENLVGNNSKMSKRWRASWVS